MEKNRKKMPKGFVWKCKGLVNDKSKTRDYNRGKTELKAVEKSENEMTEEDLIEKKIKVNEEKWRIITAYVEEWNR
mgnify:CR=1 FL=1